MNWNATTHQSGYIREGFAYKLRWWEAIKTGQRLFYEWVPLRLYV